MLTDSRDNATLAKTIAAEDLRRGDYVALLSEEVEFPSFLWCGDATLIPPHAPVRVRFRSLDRGRPLRVRAVCLPFVLVTQPCGGARTLDLRECQLARLDKQFARQVCRSLSKSLAGKKRRKAGRRAGS